MLASRHSFHAILMVGCRQRFAKQDQRDVFSAMHMMQQVQALAQTKHFPFTYATAKCQACLEEADMVEYDEDIPKKKKGS
ncbi:hypothetical protein L1987_46777 [Smallanthus sonchifolius]|uniref:Uncharacterized protein n=1 Tax=Smallanthus sonchifolius TaxID=185202 RepID=A0ACB9G0D5_9ASTR|nr:hypothetical protein L1987_46777 [Smallanthus sonchifolius]